MEISHFVDNGVLRGLYLHFGILGPSVCFMEARRDSSELQFGCASGAPSSSTATNSAVRSCASIRSSCFNTSLRRWHAQHASFAQPLEGRTDQTMGNWPCRRAKDESTVQATTCSAHAGLKAVVGWMAVGIGLGYLAWIEAWGTLRGLRLGVLCVD